MSKKAVRAICFVLAGLMVLGIVASALIYLLA
jgi:hypothetical protein